MLGKKEKPVEIGWCERVSLPELGIKSIAAKVDTGARTSALDTFSIDTFTRRGKKMVKFGVHPLRRRREVEEFCVAPIIDERWVTSSNGHREKRYVIETVIVLGPCKFITEITLTDRETMRFRMLLGRASLQNNIIIRPNKRYLLRKNR